MTLETGFGYHDDIDDDDDDPVVLVCREADMGLVTYQPHNYNADHCLWGMNNYNDDHRVE